MTLCELAGQVKTGDSFCKIDVIQNSARIDNCTDVKKAIVKSGIPIVVFVCSKGKEIFWYSGNLRSKKIETIKIPITQIIAPSVWIDFSRMYRYWQYQVNKYLTQTMSTRALNKEYIRSCKKIFKNLLTQSVSNPLTGKIEVTNKAWEHITRRGRNKIARQMSIRSACHLGHFLSTNPDRIDLKNVLRKTKEDFVYETRELIFYYRKGISFNGFNYTFAIRIDEIIIYPNQWLDQCISAENIIHKRKVASWWIKKNAC